MTDKHQSSITALEEIDAAIHYLLEDLSSGEEIDSSLQADTIHTLRQARSQIDSALLALRQRQDGSSKPQSQSLILQWTPPSTPPRQLVIEPDGEGDRWTRQELEWTGSDWRSCGRDSIEDVAIRVPAELRHATPTDPPTLETLLKRLRAGWTQPDPPALVFDVTATTDYEIVVAINDELRYREQDGNQWYSVTEPELKHHLQHQGQPMLKPLSETSLDRNHFTTSPLTDLGSDSTSNSS